MERPRLRHIMMLNISSDRSGNSYYFLPRIESNIKSKSSTSKLYNKRNNIHHKIFKNERRLEIKVHENRYAQKSCGFLIRLRRRCTGRVFGTDWKYEGIERKENNCRNQLLATTRRRSSRRCNKWSQQWGTDSTANNDIGATGEDRSWRKKSRR